MPNYPVFDTNETTGDDPSEFANIVKNWVDRLRNLFKDTTPPSNRANGDIWCIDADVTDLKHHLRENGADVALLMKHLCRQNLDFAKFQAVRMLLEKLAFGALPTPGAAEDARAVWDDTNELVKVLTATKILTLAMLEEGIHERDEAISLIDGTVGGPAVNPAAAVRDEISGYLFAATNEELCIAGRLPVGYKNGTNFRLELSVALESAETANDLLEWAGSWLRLLPNTGKTDDVETALSTQVTDIGAVVAAKTVLMSYLTIPGASFIAGDNFRITFNRATVGGAGKVANVFLLKARFLYPLKGSYAA